MNSGRREVVRLRSRLEAAFARISSIGPDELEARSDFAKYLCVLASGYLEQAVSELLIDYANRQSSPRIQRHVRTGLERFQNAKKGRILELFETFDPIWRTDLETFIDDARSSAIGAVVTERHRIAHGQDSTISYARIREYVTHIQEVIDHIADLVDPV